MSNNFSWQGVWKVCFAYFKTPNLELRTKFQYIQLDIAGCLMLSKIPSADINNAKVLVWRSVPNLPIDDTIATTTIADARLNLVIRQLVYNHILDLYIC